MATPDDLPYTSPARKLIRFFLNSRDQWKAKCQHAKATVKRLENRMRFLEKSKDEWKAKAQALEAENATLKAQVGVVSMLAEAPVEKKNSSSITALSLVPGFDILLGQHYYPLGLITLSVLLLLSACVGLRCGEKILKLLNAFFPLPRSTPSWSSSRLWLLRLGYYKLTRKKDLADDWVWIVDFTIQAGPMKCLTVVGLRRSWLGDERNDHVLCHEDVEPITLVPVQQSNGEFVYQQLEEAIEKTGVPRQIIADQGGDVKAGIQKFIATHPQTDFIYDVKHFTARILEREFKADLMWSEFTKWAVETRMVLHQTALSYLEPPNQRAKSRYMNMDLLVDWGVKALSFLDRIEEHLKTKAEVEALKKKMDWIIQFRTDLAEWKEILELVEKTEAYVRTKGLFHDGDQELRGLLRLSPKATERTLRIRWSLIEYVLDASLKAKPGERLLGSSEVLESVFGKFKYMQAEHVKGSFTGMVLAIPAMVSKTTQEVVRCALETIPVHTVRTWMKETFGKSALTKRKEAFSTPIHPEQKPDQFRLSA